LREERARRYKNRVALQKPPSPHPASESETDSCSNICSPTQSLTTPPVEGETPPRKTVSPVVKESTPTLEETLTNLEAVASNVENTTPCLTTANAVMETTPSKGDGDVHVGASSSGGGRLTLKRKRLITSSREPTIKLMRVDTEGTGKAIAGGDKNRLIKNNEVEKSSTKEIIQENELKDPIKESKGAEIKEIAKETVKEKEAVKGKYEVKQVVKKKETIKEPVREKEAVKERDVVKHVVKKTEIVNFTEKVKKKEIIKEGKETVREVVKEVVERKETVNKKEAVKGKEMTRGEIREKDMITQPVKGREMVKEAVKDKGMVKEKEIAKVNTLVKENGISTNNLLDTASPRNHER